MAELNLGSLPLVSVVVPVYNGEKYIRECLDSVLSQTYAHWECVVLDNASSDGTAAILAEYAAKDPRIRIIRNAATIPVAENHNAALALMSAEAAYCKPLMADDWLVPECLDRMVDAARVDSSIGIVCAWAFDGRHVLWDGWPYPAPVVNGREVARAHLLSDETYVFGSPTSVLLRADLVRAKPCFYHPDQLARDYESCIDLLQGCSFAFVHQVLTFQRMHQESQTSAHAAYEGGFVGRLMVLMKWGPAYLAADEFEERREARIRTYYRILANHALRGRNPGFWQYHHQQMKVMGMALDRRRLAGAVVRRIGTMIASPVQTLRHLVWRFS